MLPQNVPTVNNDDIKNYKLTGLFLAVENIMGPLGFHVFKDSHVFLKDSMIHNEHGPAVISENHDGAILRYFRYNQAYIAPTPFSSLNYSYPISPSEIHILNSPDWDGEQFTYDLSNIIKYTFVDSLNNLHCEHGPAHVRVWENGHVIEMYYLKDVGYSEPQYQIELHKKAVLEIIKAT